MVLLSLSKGWFNAAQVGVTIPLFNGQAKKQIRAQKMQVDIATFQYKSKMMSLNQNLLQLQSTISIYREGISFYDEQVQSVTPELVRISKLNYQAGDFSYLELLNTLQLMATSSKNYWEQVIAYNKAVSNYQFLTNQ